MSYHLVSLSSITTFLWSHTSFFYFCLGRIVTFAFCFSSIARLHSAHPDTCKLLICVIQLSALWPAHSACLYCLDLDRWSALGAGFLTSRRKPQLPLLLQWPTPSKEAHYPLALRHRPCMLHPENPYWHISIQVLALTWCPFEMRISRVKRIVN